MNFLHRVWDWLKFGVFNVREAARHWTPERSRLRAYLQSARKDWSAADREIIQGKSRFFVQNTGIGQRLATVFETYTAGSGLQVIPASSDPEWNAAAKKAWDAWCEMPDLNTRQSFACIQGLWAREWFESGGMFVYLTYSPDSKRPRIQNFRAHQCKSPDDRRGDATVFDGIQFKGELDKDGEFLPIRPTGYFLGAEDNEGNVKLPKIPKPAEYVIHIFEPENVGQVREVPFLAAVLNELHDLDDLRELEMKAAKEEAKTTNIVKTRNREVPNAEAMRRQRFSQSVVLNTGLSSTETRAAYVTDAIGGETVALYPDEDLVRTPGTRPSKTTMDYWRELKEEVCIGADIPYVLVYPDSMQGTVYRGSLDMAAASFRARSAVIASASRRVYEYVIEWESRNGELRGKKRPADWKNVTISAPRAPNVDIGRNAKAEVDSLGAGTTNYDSIYGPLGKDWRQELRQRAQEVKFIRDLAAEYGLEPEDIAVLPSQAKVKPEPDDKPEPSDDEEPQPARKGATYE